ncbi:MAG: DUF2520 domain-containing protein [Solirubrobacterales bacterium]
MREEQPNQDTQPSFDDGSFCLAIVGRGRAGGAIDRAARQAGLDARTTGREDIAAISADAAAALLCVPDAEIEAACEAIAVERIPPFVGHVSGATGLDALRAAGDRGAETFSLHPLQTIPDASSEIAGAPCAVTGASPRSLEFARSLALRLGLRPFTLDDDARAAYHAAACIASNFLVVLEESAAKLLEQSGVEDARELLTPLVLRTAANWSEHGADALTGPIARGDEATVARHLDQLSEQAPELIPVYEALAERARALAVRELAR